MFASLNKKDYICILDAQQSFYIITARITKNHGCVHLFLILIYKYLSTLHAINT